MINKQRNYFPNGRLNADDSNVFVGKDEIVNGENIRWGTTDAGVTGVVESIGSTKLISTPFPSLTYFEIGSAEDIENSRFCFFKYNTNGVAQAEVKATSLANPTRTTTGVVYTVSVNDPTLGNINIASYTQQTTDTTTAIFLGHLAEAIVNQNSGYTAAFTTALLITARVGVGASINGHQVIISWNTSTDINVFTGGVSATYRFDKIVCNYSDTDTEYDVLTSQQVIGGLNFDKNSIIHSAKIINGMLYWVDSTNNQPRKINIEAAIKANYPSFQTDVVPYNFPIDFREITVIKPPLPLAPNITKSVDAVFDNNFIANESFEFAFQQVWYDNETTVTGTYSRASRLNFPTDTFNRIVVTMDNLETIPDTVRFVNLVVRFGNSNNSQIVKVWDKEVTSEAEELAAQNAGTAVLQHYFYNNSTGVPLAQDDTLRPFDNVPIFSETMEQAKNRNHFANNTEGYAAPKTTSLSISLSNPISLHENTLTRNLFAIQFVTTQGAIFRGYSAWYVYVTWLYPNGYYLVSTPNTSAGANYPALPAKPTTIAVSGMIFKGTTIQDVINTEKVANTVYYKSNTFIDSSTIIITGTDQATYSVFAQKSPYKSGMAFYDFAMRKCSVVNFPNNNGYTTLISDTVNVSSDATHTITVFGDFGAYLRTGYKITLAAPAAAGTYTIESVTKLTSPTRYVLTVTETVITVGSTSALVTIATPSGLEVTTPTRDFEYTTAITGINWTLSNANRLNEIPDWAYYYTPVWTLNQRTRFFIQSFSNSNKYATKDSAGLYVFTNDAYVSGAVGIGLDTTALYQSGLGYGFTEGDICILIKSDSTVYELPVIGQQGNYIIIKAQDIGTFAAQQFVYEIYTPYAPSEQEPYYEMGEMYTIINPTTEDRKYGTLFGTLNPDAYALTRNYNTDTYFAGAMCPNDLYYKRWDTDAGKINFITKLGQVVKTQYGSFSDVFIPNTAINGLSTFRIGNEYSVPQDCGAIRKLQLTSKVQSEGTVMLSICEAETNSMYLGEAQITDSTGATQFFTQEKNVVGTINTLKGNRGTINPETVVQYRGNVFFLDMNNGRYVQYSANGLFDISDYKMARFWKLFCLQFLSMTSQQIEDLGGRPFVFSAVDGGHNELLISIPKLLTVPPKGYLPDYPDMIYPFDIYDGQGKTVVYSLGTPTQDPHWQGSYKFNPEGFTTIQNKLYGYKQGLLYLHNQTTGQNNFYGVQYTSKIMFVVNEIPNLPKVNENILVESNIVPIFVYFYNDYPIQQASDLVDYDFRELEGNFYATLRRNKLIPTATGFRTDGLLTGEKMRNTAMFVMAEFSPTTKPLSLNFIEVGYQKSLGQKV